MPIGFGDNFTPDTSGGPGQAIESGLSGINLGINIAHQKQQMEIQRQDMELKKQSLKEQQNEHIYGMFEKASNAKDLGVKKGFINLGARLYKQFNGVDVSPDFIDVINRSPEALSKVFANMGVRDMNDPQQRAQSIAEFNDAISDPELSVNMVDKFSQDQAKQKQTETLTSSRERVATENNQARDKRQVKASNLTSYRQLVKDGALPAGFNELDFTSMSPEGQANFLKMGSLINGQREDQTRQDKHDLAQSTMDWRSQRLNQLDKVVGLAGQRLTLQQQRLARVLNNDITNDQQLKPLAQAVQRGQRALELTSLPAGQVKWADFSELTADTTWMVVGSRGAKTDREKQDFASMRRWFETVAGKIKNNEVGGPSQEELNIARARVMRLQNAINGGYDDRLQKLTTSQKVSGLRQDGILQQAFDTMKADPSRTYDPSFSQGRTSTPTPKMSASEIAIERKNAAEWMQAHPETRDTVKAAFKKRTGINW